MSAVYVLFICKRYGRYESPDSTILYGDKPELEIYGVYSSKKRAKKNIDDALAKKLQRELYYLHEINWQLVSCEVKENAPESKYKGFEIDVVEHGVDTETFEPKNFKYNISWHCYIRRYVVD